MRLRMTGFTLIELMVTIAVLAILLTLAIPSFFDFRQRAALRGASDQLVSVWTNARFDALRRDKLLKVTVLNASGKMCIGVAETSDPADETTCDCFDVTPPLACGVAVYPQDQEDWRGVTASGVPTLGNGKGVAVIDPKRGGLTDRSDAGGISLKGPAGSMDYRLNFMVDQAGRAVLCEPADAPAKLSQYGDRQCAE